MIAETDSPTRRQHVTPLLGAAALALAALALGAAPALAKQKLGPVVTRTATATSPSDADQSISAAATCPGKKRAVGGGFATSSSPGRGVVVYESLRAGKKGWVNSAISYDAAQTLTTQVYCRRVKKKIADVAGSATTAPTSYAAGTAVASCPARRKLIGGGFASTVGPSPGHDYAFPYASMSSGGGWTFGAINNSADAQVLTSHAYCAKGVKAPELVTGSNSSGSEPFGGAVSASSATCSRGALSGGGFRGTPSTGTGPLLGITRSQIEPQLDGAEWAANSLNFGTTGHVSLEIQGICL